MGSDVGFDLQQHVVNWVNQLKAEPAITEDDSEELKCHLLDQIDHLKDTGLDDEEAFWVATKRMGSSSVWKDEYRDVNNPLIQIKRSLIILAGVLAYFLLYYFLKFSSKLILISLLWQEVDGHTAIDWAGRYLLGAHFLYLLFALSIYFIENKTIAFIENIKMRPKDIILILTVTTGFGILDTCLLPIAKNLMRINAPIENQFYDINFYFDYSFPFMICISFVALYVKYFRKTKSR
jgi:hypothetical protein